MTTPATVGLSTGGKVFFGSLCAGTFALGCWQIQRLQEKIVMIESRNQDLALDPTPELSSQETPFRRRFVRGTFRHDKEVLIGPRGAPLGVWCPRQGLSSNSKGNSGASGMSPGPSGFHVLTPLELSSTSDSSSPRKLVWVNRGWVPKTMVQDGRGNSSSVAASTWTRPTGHVQITAIRSSPESMYESSESFFCIC